MTEQTNEKTYTLTFNDIRYIIDKSINDVFASLAHKGIVVSTEGVVTARIVLYLQDEDALAFHVKLLDRVSVQVEEYRYLESPDEIKESLIGFKPKK